MCRLFRSLEERRPRRIEPDQPVDPGYFALLSRLHAVLAEILSTGAQVKDPRRGLVDFPARRAGRKVLLCWEVGEPAIRFWHEAGAGFASRQPVDEDGPWEDA
jgi:hypothetical protein